MTQKPSKEKTDLRGSGIPYFVISFAVWCATILSVFPRWVSNTIYWIMDYIIEVMREIDA